MIDEKKLIDRIERMNKYQEALDFLCNHAMEYVEDYDWQENYDCGEFRPLNEEDLNAHKSILQELVDKATPTKPKGLSISHDGRLGNCPNCNKIVREKDEKKNICVCGQALDWSGNQ